MSKFVRRGFRRIFRPVFPKVRAVAEANAAGLYHSGPTLGAEARLKPVFGSPMMSARVPAPTPAATPALSPELSTLKGVPEEIPTMPEYSHPPSKAWVIPL